MFIIDPLENTVSIFKDIFNNPWGINFLIISILLLIIAGKLRSKRNSKLNQI